MICIGQLGLSNDRVVQHGDDKVGELFKGTYLLEHFICIVSTDVAIMYLVGILYIVNNG